MVINELGDFLLLWNIAEYECNFLQHSGVIPQHNIAFDNGIEAAIARMLRVGGTLRRKLYWKASKHASS